MGFFALLGVLVTGVFTYASHQNRLISSDRFSAKSEFVSFEYTNCYILQTSFKSYQESISLDALKDELVYTYGLEGAPEVVGLGTEKLDVGEDLYGQLSGGEDVFFVLVSPQDASPKLKTLEVGGGGFWDTDSLDDYPLCLSEIVEVSPGDLEEIKNAYFEHEGGYYNFDVTQIRDLYVAGEVIPARAVDRTWLNKSDNYTLLFDRYRDVIEGSDIAIAMLENPLLGDPLPCQGCMTFIGDEKNVAGFKEVGFDAMGVGNHFGDGGERAIASTIELFNENGIGLPGASDSSLETATKPYIMDWNGKKVAFLSADDVAAYYWYGTQYGTNYYSNKSISGGIGEVNYEKIEKDVNAAKKLADYVIVMMSWGVEYTNRSNAHQQSMAHAFIDAGVDLVVGSHPHWVQEIEVYKDKFIIYSLGNYIFDQTSEGPGAHWSRTNGETRQGMTAKLHYYGEDLKSVDLIPHKFCGYNQAGGESYNMTHNLAWKINAGKMTYEQVDQLSEDEGCVWYQPTPLSQKDPEFKEVWDRMMEYTDI